MAGRLNLFFLIHHVALERPDGQGVVQRGAPAFALAGMEAHAGADSRQRVPLPVQRQRLVEALLPDQAHETRYVHAGGTCVLTRRAHQLGTDAGPALPVADVLDELVPEMADCRQHGVGRCLAQTAQCRVLDRIAEVDQPLNVPLPAFPFADTVQYFQHPLRADPARRTLAARFVLHELEEESRHVHHARVLIHHDETARAHDGAQLGEGFVVHGHIEVMPGDAASRWPADLRGLEALALPHPPADVEYKLAQRHADGDFHQTGVFHGSRKGEHLGALALCRAHRGIPPRTLQDDHGDGGIGLHVVQEAWFSPQTLVGGERRPGTRLAAITLD